MNTRGQRGVIPCKGGWGVGKADLKLHFWFRGGKHGTEFCCKHHVTLVFSLPVMKACWPSSFPSARSVKVSSDEREWRVRTIHGEHRVGCKSEGWHCTAGARRQVRAYRRQ